MQTYNLADEVRVKRELPIAASAHMQNFEEIFQLRSGAAWVAAQVQLGRHVRDNGLG